MLKCRLVNLVWLRELPELELFLNLTLIELEGFDHFQFLAYSPIVCKTCLELVSIFFFFAKTFILWAKELFSAVPMLRHSRAKRTWSHMGLFTFSIYFKILRFVRNFAILKNFYILPKFQNFLKNNQKLRTLPTFIHFPNSSYKS